MGPFYGYMLAEAERRTSPAEEREIDRRSGLMAVRFTFCLPWHRPKEESKR